MSDVRKLTPNVYVDAIEPCLPFWTAGLGFKITAQVPHQDRLGFVILQRGTVELMYQTFNSQDDDMPEISAMVRGSTNVLFIEVTDLDGHLANLEPLSPEIIVPRRKTFYGADEVFFRAPCGSLVGLAEFAGNASTA
jgi:hypothetical protein